MAGKQVRTMNKCFGCEGVRAAMLVGLALSISATAVRATGTPGDKKKKSDQPATVSYTPMALDSGYGPMDISDPPVPAGDIISKFEAKESKFRQALNQYTYRRSVKVETITDDGKPDGQYYEVDDIVFTPEGKRTEKVVYAPENSLTRISMSPADFQDIQQRLPFVLTKEDAGQYDVKFIGRQKVDEVPCYVFEVAPKTIEKGKRYFQGKIWVDADQLQIVVTSGKNVPDDLRKGHEDLSTPFTTYREQIDGENWFPTYTKGDGELHFTGGNGYLSQDVRVRQTVKYTDYRKFGTSTTIIYDGNEIGTGTDGKKDPDKADKPDKPK